MYNETTQRWKPNQLKRLEVAVPGANTGPGTMLVTPAGLENLKIHRALGRVHILGHKINVNKFKRIQIITHMFSFSF